MVSDRFRTFPGAFGSDALLKTASRVRTFWEMTHRPTSAVVLFYFIVCRILCQPLFYTGNILIYTGNIDFYADAIFKISGTQIIYVNA